MVTEADIPRKSYTISLRYTIMDQFKKYCEKHGYFLSKRLEILISNDMENQTK